MAGGACSGSVASGVAVAALRLARAGAAAVALVAVGSCGEAQTGGEARSFVRALAARTAMPGQPSERAASVAPGVDADTLLDWAQWRYPELFPPGPATVDLVHDGVAYAVRSYAGGNHLGVSRQGEVWGLGGYTAGRLQSFGPVAQYAAQVQADRCRVYASRCAEPTALDLELRALIARHGLRGDPAVGRPLPHIADALAQLGKLLFFSKSLSASRDTACASCHHPALAGGDGLAVSIGAGAEQPAVVGPGRLRPDRRVLVARNASTFFNTALYDRVLFADGRIESLAPAAATAGPNGEGWGIRTPDSAGAAADPRAGGTLVEAQARFPVTGAAEMRGDAWPDLSDHALRQHIAERLAAEAAAQPEGTGWLPHFRRAYGRPAGSAAELITFDNVLRAIGAYERSAVFVRSPWQRYVLGENLAIDDDAKAGAIRFMSPAPEGAGCVQCHRGDFYTDEQFHPVGFPQVGPGLEPGGADTGRARVTGAATDRHAFRTPSLLNVELTAPYGHVGSYRSLFDVIRHYVFDAELVRLWLDQRGWCSSPPLAQQPGCRSATADAVRESFAALDSMRTRRAQDPANGLPVLDRNNPLGSQINEQLQAFLRSLTDPCLKDRACIGRWVPQPHEAPDAHQLDAVDGVGRPL